MIWNYFKITFRNLLKQKTFTFINIIGLSIGMACFIFILMYVRFELSYDHFHEKADRIYRVGIERIYPDRTRHWGLTAFPLAGTLPVEYPEILEGTRLITNNQYFQVTYGENHIYNNRVIFADPNFFDVFTIPLIHGDPKKILASANSAVLTEASARLVFGDEKAVGKTLTINNIDYTVTGVSEIVPSQSHFHYDFLLSTGSVQAFAGQQWINAWGAFTYILIHEKADPKDLEAKLEALIIKYMAPEILDEVRISYEEFVKAGNGYRFFLQPLIGIHLDSRLDQEIEPNGNRTYVTLFSIVSVTILLIACINFMNLATARSANRAKEVGIRKTVGSTRKQLISQFLLESTLLCFISLLFSFILVYSLLPIFNTLTGKPLDLGIFFTGFMFLELIGFIVAVGFIAGSYPSLFLSAYAPIAVLKGYFERRKNKSGFRNALVIFQFTISIILLVSTLVVGRQIIYMLNKDLGFDKESVVVIRNAGVLGQELRAFKEELLTFPAVIGVSGSANHPSGAFDGNVHRPVGTSDDRAVSMSMVFADYDYVKTMGMKIIAGRNFSEDFSTDQQNTYVLNETAVKMLNLEDPVGTRITDHFREYTVIGVLKNFHFKSLHHEISPLIYVGILGPFANFMSVRLRSENINESLARLEKAWTEFTRQRPFEYTFLDDDLAEQYDAEEKTRQISGLFSGLAIFIGCLGLFGLAAFTAEQRTKEIGIRKVLGASIPNILFLLIKEFTKLVGIAFIIGAPLAYLAMRSWLIHFAYAVGLGVDLFVWAGLLALGIALLTVSFQAVRAAVRNPVESLRYE